MSQTVDQRIVKMKFDNAQFENGAQKTLATLDKLKNALQFKGASDSLNELQNVGKKFDFSGISNAVDSVSLRFSALQVAGITALQNITNFALGKFQTVWNNTIGQIMSGGKSRSLNIEQARFSMQGLFEGLYSDIEDVGQRTKIVGELVDEVMGPEGPVQEAVSGTAYGLDAAALAASNLLATGMDVKHLERPLKAISGLAAQTGKSYEMMADIINDAYAKSYVSGMEISRLQESGINAYAELQKYYSKVRGINYSIDEIAKKVSQKKISADDLTEALYHYYENASKANETFTGSLSNLKAALSRVGQKFYDPHIKNMTKIFNAFRIAVNALNANALGPLFDLLNSLDSIFTKLAVNVADFISNYFGFNDRIHEDLKRSSEVIPEFRDAMVWLIETLTKFSSTIKSIVSPSIGIFSSFFNQWGAQLKGIKNIWKNFIDSLSGGVQLAMPRMDAFKSIVFNITEFFKALTRVGSASIKNILRIVDAISRVLTKNILPLFGKIISIGTLLFTPFINAISKLNEPINFIYSLITKIGELLTNVFDPILTVIYKKIVSLFYSGELERKATKITESINSFFRSLKDLVLGFNSSKFGSNILDFFNSIMSLDGSSFVARIKENIDKVKSFFDPLIEKVKYAFSVLKESFSLKNFNLSNLLFLIAEGGVLTLILKRFNNIIQFKEGIENIPKTVGSVLESVKGVFEKLKDVGSAIKDFIEKFSKESITEQIRSIAISILILAGAFWILASIDTDKMLSSLGVITAFMAELLGMVFVYSKINSAKNVKGLIGIALSIMVLANALRIISKINADDLFRSVAAISILMGLLLTFSVVMQIVSSKFSGGNVKKAVKGIKNLAIAVLLLAFAVKIIGDMDKSSAEQGMKAVISLITVLGIFSTVLTVVSSKCKKGNGAMKGVLAIAGAIVVLSLAVRIIGQMDKNAAEQGLFGVIALITVLGIFSSVLTIVSSKFKKGSSAIAGVLSLAIAMLILAQVVKVFGNMDTEAIVKGIVSLTVMLGVITLFFLAFNALGIGSGKMLAISTSLLVVGAALVLFAASIRMLAEIPMKDLAFSLLILVGALAAIGAIAYLFGTFAAALVVGITLIAAIGASVALFGAGILALAMAMTILSPIMVMFTKNLLEAGKVFIQGIISLQEEITNLIIAVVTSIFRAIRETTPEFLKTLTALLDAFLQFFNDNLLVIVDAGLTLALAFLNGITVRVPELIDAGFNLLIAVLNGLGDAFEARGDEVGAAAGRLIEGLILGLWSAAVGLWTEIENFAKEMIEEHFGVDLGEDSLFDIGLNLIKGLWEGFKSWMGQLWSNIKEWGLGLIKNTKEEIFDIKSPSKVFEEIGEYCMEGMAIGLSKTDSTFKAVDEAGDNIISAFKSTISKIDDAINSDMNMSPTITPVLDLSQIQNGVSTMNGMFGVGNGLTASISGRVARINQSRAENEFKSIMDSIKDDIDNRPVVNMTVYGAQGQDVRELAEIVSNRIQHQLSRREMAYG